MKPTLYRSLQIFKELAEYWRISFLCSDCHSDYEICGICGETSEPGCEDIKHDPKCNQKECTALAKNIQIIEAGIIDNMQGEEYQHEWGFCLGPYYFAIYVADESGKCFQDVGKLWGWLETASRILRALSVSLIQDR
jgi:hypothetical protein